MDTLTASPQILVSSQEFKQQLIAQAKADAEQNRRDETAAGGRYITATGRVVDANGNIVTEELAESSAAKAAELDAAARAQQDQAAADAEQARLDAVRRQLEEQEAATKAAADRAETTRRAAEEAAKAVPQVEGTPDPDADPRGGEQITMTHAELDAAAARAEVDVSGAGTKAEKAKLLRDAGIEVN